jgi:hypothetical protein
MFLGGKVRPTDERDSFEKKEFESKSKSIDLC